MEHLSRYNRVTVGLWARSHGALARPAKEACLVEAAVHAVLAGLRLCDQPGVLLARYEADAASDFALIGSLVDGTPSDEILWQIRDAAYHLRWCELNGSA